MTWRNNTIQTCDQSAQCRRGHAYPRSPRHASAWSGGGGLAPFMEGAFQCTALLQVSNSKFRRLIQKASDSRCIVLRRVLRNVPLPFIGAHVASAPAAVSDTGERTLATDRAWTSERALIFESNVFSRRPDPFVSCVRCKERLGSNTPQTELPRTLAEAYTMLIQPISGCQVRSTRIQPAA